MEGKPVPSNAMCQCPLYLFDHVLYPIRPPPILVQLYHFSHVDELYQHYSEMVEHMTKVRQSEGKKMESYNFLLFKKWLMLVPRTRVGLLIVSELLGDVEFNQC